MRLIDGDEVVKALDEALKEQTDITDIIGAVRKQLLVGFAKQVLSDAPTVEAEPVRHGEWIMEFDEISQRTNWRCSVCNKHGRGDYKRCPWCGAKMEGVEE